ncbi:MAG: endonuclease/exonuclease/phosphatase family protein, partial [Novipirellula sp. JB048]
FIAGDFNSMSHLDWSEVNVDQNGAQVQWPTSQVLIDAGYRDSYRETNPFFDRLADRTWSPRFPDQEQDRIDFIYYRSNAWQATESRVIEQHAEKFPSDHSAVLTRFKASPPPAAETNFRVLSYNIRHGRGMDNVVDLNRTAAVIEKLQPDFVGLQEVDQRVARSGDINEPAELAKQLGMHAAFGSFMDLQGGRYGLAVLENARINRFVVENASFLQ